MGGGGSYYDRDVTSRSRRTSRGFSDVAEERMRKSKVDQALLPRDRRLVCESKNPIVYVFDVTGSMGDLPRIIYDKMPNIAGELGRCEYLEDPMMSIAAVGDTFSDYAPLQVCDFSAIRSLDVWLQRIWLEGHGGGQAKESYEFIAYFYARMVELPNAVTPIFLFTGDEGFYETLVAGDLKEHFGKEHGVSTNTEDIFKELKRKFKGNVFLLHPTHAHYGPETERTVVAQWEKILGKEHVVKLQSKLAIADVTLGIFALASGKRTLEEYLEDMRNRPLDLGGEKFEPQTPERIEEVKKTLTVLDASLRSSGKPRRTKTSDGTEQLPTRREKPGRI